MCKYKWKKRERERGGGLVWCKKVEARVVEICCAESGFLIGYVEVIC